MRGRRRRSRTWPQAPNGHRRAVATRALTDAKTDEALRALARILARQAARDLFNRESKNNGSDHSTDEDQR
jgi:hypothetical protein